MAFAIGPRKRTAVRVGGITCGEDNGIRLRRFSLMRTQPIHGTSQRELRGTQALNEVSAATGARILERAERPVGDAEATAAPTASMSSALALRRTPRASGTPSTPNSLILTAQVFGQGFTLSASIHSSAFAAPSSDWSRITDETM